ncbi:hypothetical protein FOZ63_023000, partial [Perkinsus olseni]
EDMMAAGEDSPWEDNEVGSLSKAFRRSSDIGDEGLTDGGDYSAAAYSGSASESPFTDGGETVDAENDGVDDEEAEVVGGVRVIEGRFALFIGEAG